MPSLTGCSMPLKNFVDLKPPNKSPERLSKDFCISTCGSMASRFSHLSASSSACSPALFMASTSLESLTSMPSFFATFLRILSCSDAASFLFDSSTFDSCSAIPAVLSLKNSSARSLDVLSSFSSLAVCSASVSDIIPANLASSSPVSLPFCNASVFFSKAATFRFAALICSDITLRFSLPSAILLKSPMSFLVSLTTPWNSDASSSSWKESSFAMSSNLAWATSKPLCRSASFFLALSSSSASDLSLPLRSSASASIFISSGFSPGTFLGSDAIVIAIAACFEMASAAAGITSFRLLRRASLATD